MASSDINNIAIITVKDVDYRCIIYGIIKILLKGSILKIEPTTIIINV